MAFIFTSQEGKSIEMEKSQNAQSSTTKITSSKSSSPTIASSTSPKISEISKISKSSISASSAQSSSSSSSSSSTSTTSSTSSSSSSEAIDAPGNMYDSIEYEYNALPIKDVGGQEPSEDPLVNSPSPDADDNVKAGELKNSEAEEDGEEESELENPGDYYLNEGDEEESTTNPKNFLDSPSLTSIFFDIPDPGSYPPGTRLKYSKNILNNNNNFI